jgi:hypothetical protein
MDRHSDLVAILLSHSESLRSDGVDLQLEGVTDGIATVRVIVEPNAGLGLLLSRDMLEWILLTSFRKRRPDVVAVRLKGHPQESNGVAG